MNRPSVSRLYDRPNWLSCGGRRQRKRKHNDPEFYVHGSSPSLTYAIQGPRHRSLRYLTTSAERSKSPKRTPSPTCRPDPLRNVANLATKLHYFSRRASDLSPSMNSNVNVVLPMVLLEP